MKIRCLVLIAATVAWSCLWGADEGPLSPRQKLIKEHRDFIIRTGGYVIKPDPGNRAVVIANAQTRIPTKVFMRTLGYMRFAAKINFDMRDLQTVNEPYANLVRETGAAVLVLVVDKQDSSTPIFLSPDERWAVVNVSALAYDNPGDGVLQMRFRAALVRAICYSCGGGASKSKAVPTAPLVDGIGDYDRLLPESIAPDQISFISAYLQELGSRPIIRTTYEVACQEGWAAAPTNKVQQAVWDKVHAIPDMPMKIEFDPKKGR